MRVRVVWAATIAALAVTMLLGSADAASPAFVQARAKEVTSGTTNSLAFSSANGAGNLIVVYVVWSNTGSVSLADTRGNAYVAAAPRRPGDELELAGLFRAQRRCRQQYRHRDVRERRHVGEDLPPRVLRARPGEPARRRNGVDRNEQRHEQWIGDDDHVGRSALRGRSIQQPRQRHGKRVHGPLDRAEQPHRGPRSLARPARTAQPRRKTDQRGSCTWSRSGPREARRTSRLHPYRRDSLQRPCPVRASTSPGPQAPTTSR